MHGIRRGPQAPTSSYVESMSLTIGSGTWSTLARGCGRYLPYLRRSAARAYVAHQLRGGVQCDGGLDGQDLLFRPAFLTPSARW